MAIVLILPSDMSVLYTSPHPPLPITGIAATASSSSRNAISSAFIDWLKIAGPDRFPLFVIVIDTILISAEMIIADIIPAIDPAKNPRTQPIIFFLLLFVCFRTGPSAGAGAGA
ncbi:hypothetical protein HanRHA438_Chr02g0051911 [Helianthus annuus]|nr:hypothetical protein HanIR_Chr02g0056661 [Helianthus annuus]KAJ0938628.1 hypothetical protein HanRHA438_Chr02g0051911 [Helianthus annuus]